MSFSKDFIFGTATSSYQIEGAYHEDGKTDSIWDVFTRKEGAIIDHSNGDVACDHYHLFKEDIQLMKKLGINSYRLSIAWPRIISEKGNINEKGIKFYREVMEELKRNGIGVSVTMYHWDLPQWIYEENKGWPHRDTVAYFLEYAKVLFSSFDDIVDMWITLNEPWCSSFLSYFTGEHAPGHKNYQEFAMAHHHLLLAHGKTVAFYRENYDNKPIGITLNPTHTYSPSQSFEDEIARMIDDGFRNRFFYEPLFKGRYPMDVIAILSKHIQDFSFVQDGDLDEIANKMDFLGVNFYSRDYVTYHSNSEFLFTHAPSDLPRTEMKWEVTPWALEDLVVRLRNEYTDIPIYITENGAAFKDELIDGKVNDEDRINYINLHLKAVEKCNEMGLNIKGYYVWSLMDNFEWAYGYTKRFGIIYVDYKTLKRIPKKSYYRYQEIIKNREI